MNLLIVESPTKARTIQRFLSGNFCVKSSYGHVRDLPQKKFGVDIKDNFKPKYITIPKAKKNVEALKKETEKASSVILATDEDREGEAIAWHLTQALQLGKFQTPSTKSQTNSKLPACAKASAGRQIPNLKPYQRIVFHEITKSAIEEALKNPRELDMNLVDAQQARRILDRIVGYKLSPFLWKKVAKGLSAGRVQSVAVKLVVEREKEIENFKPQEYWTIEAELKKLKKNAYAEKVNSLMALLIKKNGETIPKFDIKSKKEAAEIVKDLNGAEYIVKDITKKETKKNSPPPFTTSTLQQEGWQRLHFTAKLTMSLAQGLYERGFITYHRTDSLNIADQALFGAKKFIIDNYGKEYWAGFFKKYKAKGKVQEAHEATRPTFITKTPEGLKNKLDNREFRLYDLIWRRFVACQMAQASFDSTRVEIKALPPLSSPSERGEKKKRVYTFQASGQILKFEGFLKVYPMRFKETQLPPLEKNEALDLIKLDPSQHFTQPPAKYSEASLIKALEQNGIGRPSTYAPIISTIQERNYIEKDDTKKFRPNEIGVVVTELLIEHFPKIVDIRFTARMEKDLDKVAQGEEKWVPVVQEFYGPFAANLEKKYQEVSKTKIAQKTTEKKCPKCGGPIIIRLGKFGKFYACSKFPKCRFTESITESSEVSCPKCQKGNIVEKRTRRGKIFYGCSLYPQCDFALWDRPLNEKCPKCGSLLVSKNNITKCSNKECGYKK